MASRVDKGGTKYQKSFKMDFFLYSGEDRILAKLKGCIWATYFNYRGECPVTN